MAEYDPARDLATLLHAALRQGFWGLAARGAIERLRNELGLEDSALASDIEQALRHRMAHTAGRAAALENVRYLAALPDHVLREALLTLQCEQPEKAAQLHRFLSGQEDPDGITARLEADAEKFRAGTAELDTDGFVRRTLDRLGIDD